MSILKIGTWNVNSLRQRMAHLQEWLRERQPDVLALQETKVTDDLFPLNDIKSFGYEAVFSGQKSYNGVAILSRHPISEPEVDILEISDPQRRILAATVGDVRIVNLYVPNGYEVGSEKYAYKLDWLDKMRIYLARALRDYPRTVVVGDFNIAPQDVDVHDPDLWRDKILCSSSERAAFHAMLDLGFVDCFRRFEQPAGSFSWWDYRQGGFRRNLGLRIDHILASPALMEQCVSCRIDTGPRKREKPSDHAPVLTEFACG